MLRPPVLAVLVLGACAPSHAPGPPISAVTPAPDWNAVFERSEGWLGGDGAATVALHNGFMLWLFGDSGIGRIAEGRYAPGSTLVNNTVAIHPLVRRLTSVPPGPDAVRFSWGTGADGKPAATFASRRAGEWYWPTGGGYEYFENGPALVLFMSRVFRPRERDDGVWNFEGRGSDMVIITRPGPDAGEWEWRAVPTPGSVGPDLAPPARRITWGTCVEAGRNGLIGAAVIFGIDTTDPLNKKVLLAAVPSEQIADTSAWRFWSGREGDPWSASVEDAAPVADHAMDEFSVSWIADDVGPVPPLHRWDGRYVLIHSRELLGREIMARTAREPWGPWSEPVAVYACPEPLSDARLMAYSAKAHLELSRPGELLVSYCVNSTDFWHMLSDATIYRPRFVRVPVSVLPAPPGK